MYQWPWFESKVHNTCFFQFIVKLSLVIGTDDNKQNGDRVRPIFKTLGIGMGVNMDLKIGNKKKPIPLVTRQRRKFVGAAFDTCG